MTNTKQWIEAEGLLLRNHLFPPPNSATNAGSNSPSPKRQKTTENESWGLSVGAESGDGEHSSTDGCTSGVVGALHFCNYIQRHYTDATNQNPFQMERTILPSEFVFLFSKKIGKDLLLAKLFDGTESKDLTVVTMAEFDRFWEWFGAVLQKIRYQKFLYQLWSTGLIYGFIDKTYAEELLA